MPLQVTAGREAAREVDVDAVAVARDAVDVRPTGEGQPEQPGDLVEGLAGGVVDGRAHRVDADGDVGDAQQRGVATADQHRQAGLGQRAVLELVDSDVRSEVVDAVDRLAEPDRQRLRGGDADHQRSRETRTAGHGDGVDVVQADARRLAGPLDGRDHRLEVSAARDLGHDAAEASVLLDAARHRVGQQRVALHDPDTGLVAGRLDAEDQGLAHAAHSASPPQPRRRDRRSTTAVVPSL